METRRCAPPTRSVTRFARVRSHDEILHFIFIGSNNYMIMIIMAIIIFALIFFSIVAPEVWAPGMSHYVKLFVSVQFRLKPVRAHFPRLSAVSENTHKHDFVLAISHKTCASRYFMHTTTEFSWIDLDLINQPLVSLRLRLKSKSFRVRIECILRWAVRRRVLWVLVIKLLPLNGHLETNSWDLRNCGNCIGQDIWGR